MSSWISSAGPGRSRTRAGLPPAPSEEEAMAKDAKGQVVQVIGTVVDVEFPREEMPEVLNAIEVPMETQTLVLEVQQHTGNNWVRCLALGPTEGLARGSTVVDTGAPIRVPVGRGCLGRLFNVLGQPLDDLEEVEAQDSWPIHRAPPSMEEQQTTTEILETGLKVVDLVTPFTKGGKIGAYGGAGVGKTVIIQELIPKHCHGAPGLLRLRGRGRTLPRGQRPLARDAGLRCAQERDARLWPDERAAGRAGPGGPHRPDHGRVLPRRGGARTSCSSSTTSTGTSWRAWRCLRCWVVCLRQSATSPPWARRWARLRSASPPPGRAPSPPSRPSTCRPTTTRTPASWPPSATWTRSSPWSGPSPSRASTPHWTRWPRPPVSSTPRWWEKSTTGALGACRPSSSGTGTSRTSLRSWAWRSSPRRTSSQ